MSSERRLGTYELLEPLGEQGALECWLARARCDDGNVRTVVVESMDQSHEMAERFLHETHKLARLNHPALAQVFDVGRLEGRCYLAREHLPGPSLRAVHDRCRTRGEAIPAWLLARVAAQIGDALQCARFLGASDGHQWITPDRVTIGVFGRCGVGGLGRHRALGQGVCKGQRSAGLCRCDVISLGATLFEMLTGVPIFSRSSVHQHNTFRGMASVISPELEGIVTRSMAISADAVPEPGELSRLLSGLLLDLEDRHGRPEIGLFVSSLFPELLDRGVANLEELGWWDGLETFAVTRDEQRWTEPKLAREADPTAFRPRRIETGRGSWIRRILVPTPRTDIPPAAGDEAPRMDIPPASSPAVDERPPPEQHDPWTRASRTPTTDPSGEDRIAALWERASARKPDIHPRPTSDDIFAAAKPAARPQNPFVVPNRRGGKK